MIHYICTIDKKTGVNLLSMQSIESIPIDSSKFNAEYTMQAINMELLLDGLLRNLQKNTVYYILDGKKLVNGKFYFIDGGSEDIGYSQNSWYTKKFFEFCAEKGIQIV